MPPHLPAPPTLTRWLAGLLALLLCLAAQAQPASTIDTIDTSQRGSGTAVAMGGAVTSNRDAIFSRLVAAAGGAGSRWVVFGTASDDPMGSAAGVVDRLARHGAVAVALPVSPRLQGQPVADAVRDPALVAQVRAATGVFFTGGEQSRIVDALQPGGQATPLLQAVWSVYRAGGVVAGSSAGAAIMSTTMFRDPPDVLTTMQGPLRDGQEVDRGLGFFGPALFIDQHFLKRGRVGRMLPLLLAKGYTLGLGVDENSAAFLRGDTVEILGRALLVNLADARSDPALGAFNLANARVSLLDTGDTLRLPGGQMTPAPAKQGGQLLDPAAPGYAPYHRNAPFYADMLGDNMIANAMGQLIDGRFAEVRGMAFHPHPSPDNPLGALGFAFTLSKGPGSIGWTTQAGGSEDYSVRDLRLAVRPIRLAQPLYTAWPPDQRSQPR
jgi:cyanophycinase